MIYEILNKNWDFFMFHDHKLFKVWVKNAKFWSARLQYFDKNKILPCKKDNGVNNLRILKFVSVFTINERICKINQIKKNIGKFKLSKKKKS